MEKRKNKAATVGKRHSAERFEIVEIKRHQIKNAPYNPRTIKAENKKKLKNNLSEVGLLAPIIWNETTGNVVSGHQRLKILDELATEKDYTLTVSKVKLSEKTEKEQNLFMNNKGAQGEYDLDLLAELYEDDGIDFEKGGFDIPEIKDMFGEELTAMHSEDLAAMSARYKEGMEVRKRRQAKSGKDEDNQFFVVLVFETQEERDFYLRQYQLPVKQYQNGRAFMEQLEK